MRLLWVLSAVAVWNAKCEVASKALRSFYKLDDEIQETVWCGDDNSVILVRTEANSVYRSEDRGETFTHITKRMQKTAEQVVANSTEVGEVTRIIKVEADNNILLFVGNRGVFWVSTNCGKTMKALNKEFMIAQIRSHPTESSTLLATAVQNCRDEEDDLCFYGTHSLYLTEDLGETWRQVASNVKQFDWVFDVRQIYLGIPRYRIFALVRTSAQDILVKTDDFFKSRTVLVNNCLEFKLRSAYLFAIKGVKGDEVHLLVSSIKNNFDKFHRATFPDVKLKMKNVHILDSSEGVVFLLTTRKPTAPFGRLYVSDSTGLRFRLALKSCLRSSVRGADFAKIQGLEGVYIANILEKEAAKEYERMMEKDDTIEEEWIEEERKESTYYWTPRSQKRKDARSFIINNVQTVITYNKGGMWKLLRAPKTDSEGSATRCKLEDECSLHLFLYVDTTVPILSQNNAPGIIIATGNLGFTRRPSSSQRRVYMSRDGGLKWIEAVKEESVYEIADHGGLVLMAKLDSGNKDVVSLAYTWNGGSSWENVDIYKKNTSIEDIYTEPNATSQRFMLHMTQKDDIEDDSILIHSSLACFNFEELHQRTCEGEDKPGTPSSDFEYWNPYDGRQGQDCLLGRKITYVRKKKDRECFTRTAFAYAINIENCECTEEDYECDFGFVRSELSGDHTCIPKINVTYAPPEDCPSETNYTVTTGYRKITGDSCVGGITHDPLMFPCPRIRFLSSSSGLKMLGVLGGVVIVVLGIWYGWQNVDTLRGLFKESKKGKKGRRPYERQFENVKYAKIDEKQDKEDDDELIIGPSTVTLQKVNELH
jgi:hypothetical protein